MKQTSVEFSGLDYTASASITSTGVSRVFDLTDEDGRTIAPKYSIASIEFNDGEGDYIDGFCVRYRVIDPKTGEITTSKPVIHGTFKQDKVHHKILNLDHNEHICAAKVVYFGKDSDEEYIGRITLWARRPGSNHAYQAGDWGETPSGEGEPFYWHWDNKDGELYSFGTRENNQEDTRGLKTLAFSEHRGSYAVNQSASYPEYDPSAVDPNNFDDFKKYGAAINPEFPIKAIDVWADRVVEGIRVTYNINGNKTLPVMHGSKLNNVAPTRITLTEHESIVEITGIHGEACPDTKWGDRINLLEFKIYNAKVGMFRSSGTCGKIQENFNQKTRKDICVRGPLVALAGRADNKAKNIGLFNLKCFTRVPPWKAVGGKLVSGATEKAAEPKTTATNGTTPNGTTANGTTAHLDPAKSSAPDTASPTSPQTTNPPAPSAPHC